MFITVSSPSSLSVSPSPQTNTSHPQHLTDDLMVEFQINKCIFVLSWPSLAISMCVCVYVFVWLKCARFTFEDNKLPVLAMQIMWGVMYWLSTSWILIKIKCAAVSVCLFDNYNYAYLIFFCILIVPPPQLSFSHSLSHTNTRTHTNSNTLKYAAVNYNHLLHLQFKVVPMYKWCMPKNAQLIWFTVCKRRASSQLLPVERVELNCWEVGWWCQPVAECPWAHDSVSILNWVTC